MDEEDASRLVANVDEDDHDGRTGRLLELVALLPDDDLVGFSGQAAQWLFEDVKATWLYGCFTSTVLTAHAFCLLQVAGLIRLLPDNPDLPEEASSLEELAGMAVEAGALEVEQQAKLLTLHDRFRSYTTAHLHEHPLSLEQHMVDTETVGDGEHPLLIDARQAMTAAVGLIYRR
jgi:hypothetical protein